GQPVAVVAVQPVDRLEGAELHPAGVQVVGELGGVPDLVSDLVPLGAAQVPGVVVAADVVADRGHAGGGGLGRGGAGGVPQGTPAAGAVAGEVHRVALLRPRAGGQARRPGV